MSGYVVKSYAHAVFKLCKRQSCNGMTPFCLPLSCQAACLHYRMVQSEPICGADVLKRAS